jgi:hypothetical protein
MRLRRHAAENTRRTVRFGVIEKKREKSSTEHRQVLTRVVRVPIIRDVRLNLTVRWLLRRIPQGRRFVFGLRFPLVRTRHDPTRMRSRYIGSHRSDGVPLSGRYRQPDSVRRRDAATRFGPGHLCGHGRGNWLHGLPHAVGPVSGWLWAFRPLNFA